MDKQKRNKFFAKHVTLYLIVNEQFLDLQLVYDPFDDKFTMNMIFGDAPILKDVYKKLCGADWEVKFEIMGSLVHEPFEDNRIIMHTENNDRYITSGVLDYTTFLTYLEESINELTKKFTDEQIEQVIESETEFWKVKDGSNWWKD